MKTLTLAALLIIGLGACNKPENPEPDPQSITVNSTESSMMGVWHLKKERYVNAPVDTTFTAFSSSPYVAFSDSAYSSEGNGQQTDRSKASTDRATLVLPNVGAAGFTRGGSSSEQPWYCDSVTNTLVYGNTAITYKIITLNSASLVLSLNTGTSTQADTLWFEK